jgi:uncharacterized protein YceK
MKKLLILITTVVSLSGCSVYDMITTTTVYCSELSEDVRQAALERMQDTWSGYPAHSICDNEGFIVDIIKPDD